MVTDVTIGMTGGFSIEPQEHATLGKGVEGKMVAAFVGWSSLEAHEAWSQSEEYGKAVAPVVEGSTGMDVGHVEFVKFE
jgi:heme-degrading monooxygenase HmoA